MPKGGFLLAALSDIYPNLVDNLTTKPDLTTAEVRYRILSLASNDRLEDTSNSSIALVTGHTNKKRKQEQSSPSAKSCSYCKKHRSSSGMSGKTAESPSAITSANRIKLSTSQSSNRPMLEPLQMQLILTKMSVMHVSGNLTHVQILT